MRRSDDSVGWNISIALLYPIICILRVTLYTCRPAAATRFDGTTTLDEQLRNNWDPNGGFRAGMGHYANVWTRDAFFALFGASNRSTKYKEFVNRLRNDMTAKHQVPFTYNRVYYVRSVFFPWLPDSWKKRRTTLVEYNDEKLHRTVMDANAQFVIMCCYANDRRMVREALEWYTQFVVDGLVEEEAFGSWEDTLMLGGAIPYTNILVLRAQELTRKHFGIDIQIVDRQKVFDLVLNRGKPGGLDAVSVSMMALWWTRASGAKEALLELSTSFGWHEDEAPPLEMIRNRQRRLPNSWVFLPARLIGQGEYHRGWRWSWVGCLFCWALVKRGLVERAQRHFAPYQQAREKYNTIHEVYDQRGAPINIALYRSEKCFSEGLGMYLRAHKEISASTQRNI
jgi:hypothetical protein